MGIRGFLSSRFNASRSIVQMFNCSSVQMFNCFAFKVQMLRFYCSTVQILNCSIICLKSSIVPCTNPHIFTFLNFQIPYLQPYLFRNPSHCTYSNCGKLLYRYANQFTFKYIFAFYRSCKRFFFHSFYYGFRFH